MRSKGKRTKETEKKKGLKAFSKIIIVALFVTCVGVVINLAPNYIRTKVANKVTVIINNNDVTKKLKHDIKIDDNEVIYLSFEDIENFFDENIYYDKQYDQIITSGDTKLASIEIGQKQMHVNSSKVNIYSTAEKDKDTYYLPFSEMKSVYNVDIKYSKDSNVVTIDSLNREQKMGNVSNNASVKYKPTTFSKTLEKVKKGDSIIVIDSEKGWYKIRTTNGNIGYLKDVTNIYVSRKAYEKEKQVNGKVSIVWDYFTNTAPTRSGSINGINVVSPSFASIVKQGKGELYTRIGNEGQAYINWAHNNGYKIWTIVSNDSLQDTTSEILNDYKLRETLINNIVNLVVMNNLDGVNIDFENVKESDKDVLSRFIIELAPRLAENEKVLSMDVTAPDGGGSWSMCYDRHKLGKVVDYLVFMAYDQYGDASNEAGTTAGADWIEVNLKKFVGTQEEVEANKIVLGMPFYTRLWKEAGGSVTKDVIYMRSIDSNIPNGTEKVWDENLKQYYVEFQRNGATYKMWIEDTKSIQAKFDLMHQYKLAGAAYWQKDFESANIWDVIETEINK